MKWIGWCAAFCALIAIVVVYSTGRRRLTAVEARNARLLLEEQASVDEALARVHDERPGDSERLETQRARVRELEQQLAVLERTRTQLRARLADLKQKTEALEAELTEREVADKEHQDRIRTLQARRAQILREVRLLQQAVTMVTGGTNR